MLQQPSSTNNSKHLTSRKSANTSQSCCGRCVARAARRSSAAEAAGALVLDKKQKNSKLGNRFLQAQKVSTSGLPPPCQRPAIARRPSVRLESRPTAPCAPRICQATDQQQQNKQAARRAISRVGTIGPVHGTNALVGARLVARKRQIAMSEHVVHQTQRVQHRRHTHLCGEHVFRKANTQAHNPTSRLSV